MSASVKAGPPSYRLAEQPENSAVSTVPVQPRNLVAVESGRQPKRTRVPQLIADGLDDPDRHMELAQKLVHPGFGAQAVSADQGASIRWLQLHGAESNNLRVQIIHELEAKAKELEPQRLESVQRMGRSCAAVLPSLHVPLMEWCGRKVGIEDKSVPRHLELGLPIIGESIWTPFFVDQAHESVMSVQTLLATARVRREKIIASVAAHEHRFDDVSLRAVYESTQAEVVAGTMGPAMRSAEEVTEKHGAHWNVVRRFPIFQNGKLRNIDDNSESANNSAATRRQKVALTSVSRQLLILREVVKAFPLSQWPEETAEPTGSSRDMRKAYRQCPLLLAHIAMCIIAVFNPDTKSVEFYEMFGQPFGASLAVLNFCRLSEWLCRVATRLLHLVLDHYFDDFSLFEPKFSAPSAFWALGRLFQLFGFVFDEGKDVLPTAVFPSLGVVFDLRHVRRNSLLKVRPKPTRITKILEELRSIRAKGSLTSGEASRLVGKLLFVAETLFGRVSRCALSAFRARQYSKAVRLSLDLEAAISWWPAALFILPPRELPVYPREERPTLLYTDASEERGTANT